MHFLIHVFHGLGCKQHVFSGLDGAHVQHKSRWQCIALAHFVQLFGRCSLAKTRVAALIYHANALFGIVAILHDVALGALANGDNAVGLFQRFVELPTVNQRVPPMVELGMAHKNKVVNGDNGIDACVFNAFGQFARQAMKHLYAIAQQVFHHAATSPRCLLQRVFRALGVHHAQVRRTFHLSGQVFSARIGCIKQQLCVRVKVRKVVNQVSSIRSQARSVTHYAFGIKAHDNVLVFVHQAQTYTKNA